MFVILSKLYLLILNPLVLNMSIGTSCPFCFAAFRWSGSYLSLQPIRKSEIDKNIIRIVLFPQFIYGLFSLLFLRFDITKAMRYRKKLFAFMADRYVFTIRRQGKTLGKLGEPKLQNTFPELRSAFRVIFEKIIVE